MFLIVENLRLYLESEEIVLASNGGRFMPDGTEEFQTPLFLGRRFAEGGDRNKMFISGGSGYTMNKAALKTLVVDAFPQCFPHMHTFSEDVMVATCLRKVNINHDVPLIRAPFVHNSSYPYVLLIPCQDGHITL